MVPSSQPKRSLFRRPSLRALCGVIGLFAVSIKPVMAASNGENAASLRTEGRNYEIGNGVPRDPQKAAELYCEAARLGDIEAQYNLGWMYANGRGIPRDDGVAAHFFSLAAKQGDALSARMLRQVGEPDANMPDCLKDKPPPEQAHVDPLESLAAKHRKIADLIRKLAPEYGVIPGLAAAIIRAESNFNPEAVSPKNAQGLMQLIPETAERFNVQKPFDPEQNIRGGLAYLRWLLAYFKGDVALVAAGYNAGEGAVNRYAGIPPYAETQDYVKRIRELFKADEHPFDARVTPPSPEIRRIVSRKRMM